MGSTLLARRGGAVSAGFTDLTAKVPAFDQNGKLPLIQMGMRLASGEASQGMFVVMDSIANTDGGIYLPPHALVRWVENAAGSDYWLAQGRVGGLEIGKGALPEDDHVEWAVTTDDCNMDLGGQAFTADWVRPAETDYARLVALQAYTLNGNSSTATNFRPSTSITVSSTHLAPNTNTVSMPVQTYPAGTQPSEVVDDCASTAGKIFGVVIHHTGGSHLCLEYIIETDHSTYASTVKISDEIGELDQLNLTAPVFGPRWKAGKGQLVDGHSQISGLVSRYGSGNAVITAFDSSYADRCDYWTEAYQDGDSVNATQAGQRANSILAYRKLDDETNRVSVYVMAEQTYLLAAGMSIQIKASVIGTNWEPDVSPRLDMYLDRRVVQCVWEPAADGFYWAHLELNRSRRSAPSGGKAQPAATMPGKPGIDSPQVVALPPLVPGAALGTILMTSRAYMTFLNLSSHMYVNGLNVRVTTANVTGVMKFGLFSYIDPSNPVLVMSGENPLAATNWKVIGVDSVAEGTLLPAGCYILIVAGPAANAPTLQKSDIGTTLTPWRVKTGYTWTDTPTLGDWTQSSEEILCFLHGDLDANNFDW